MKELSIRLGPGARPDGEPASPVKSGQGRARCPLVNPLLTTISLSKIYLIDFIVTYAGVVEGIRRSFSVKYNWKMRH